MFLCIGNALRKTKFQSKSLRNRQSKPLRVNILFLPLFTNPGMSGLVRLPQLTKKPRHRWGTADDGSLTIKEPQYSNVVSKPVGISHVFK